MDPTDKSTRVHFHFREKKENKDDEKDEKSKNAQQERKNDYTTTKSFPRTCADTVTLFGQHVIGGGHAMALVSQDNDGTA